MPSRVKFEHYLAILFVMVFAIDANSACTTPAGVAGQIAWIPGLSSVAFCDNTNWVDLSVAARVDSCAVAGKIQYQSNEMQFCNGTNWISMDAQSIRGSCTQPGALNYDSTNNLVQWCDGSAWKKTGGTVSASSLTHITHGVSNSDSSSYTFSALSFGAANLYRYVIVGIVARSSTARTFTSVTIGGVGAIPLGTYASGFTLTAFYAAHIPTGTTGDLVVTFNGPMVRMAYSAWRAVNIQSLTAVSSATISDFNFSHSINARNEGFALASAYANYGTGMAWTGLTENVDQLSNDTGLDWNYSFASFPFVANQASRPVSVNISGSWADTAGIILSIR